jgi:hypothetical protein
MLRKAAALLAFASLAVANAASAQQAMDANNPTCPQNPNWSTYRQMRFTPETQPDGRVILRAEGMIDEDVPARLRAALEADPNIEEVWLRSPGGHARAGNEAGRIIRQNSLTTRIPSGWACFSACNFMFMGGEIRHVDSGGLFMVHMFTHTNDRDAIRAEVQRGESNTIQLMGELEQRSALLASEDNDFLIRMGISRQLLTEVMYRQSAVAGADRSTRRCLTTQEVLRYNVSTPAFGQ